MTAVKLGLRLGRWGLLGFSAVGFIATFINAVAFYAVAGHTQAEREAFAKSFAQIAAQLTVLLPPPTRLDTVGGYVQYRAYGSLVIVFAIWALAAATGAARADEERGIVEMILATGLSRARAITARIAAFAIAAFVAALAASLGLFEGAVTGQESFPIGPALEAALLLAVFTLSCYSLVLLVAQLVAPRMATPAAAAVLLALFLLNSLSRTFDSLATVRWLSPFRYYELSRPLAPGGNLDLNATLVLAGIALVSGALATVAFTQRDLGSALFALRSAGRPPTHEPSRAAVWRVPVIRGLYDRRVGLLGWTAGVAVMAALFVVLTKTIVQPLLAIPGLAGYFASFIHGDVFASFLSFIWFGFAELLMAGYAISEVARWSAEDIDGRLELILSNPVSRTRVVIERAVVLALGALVIASVSGLAVGVESHYQGIDLDFGRLAEASLLLVPFTLVFGAVGALLAARLPRATIGIL
ncbi:MAG: polyether ionophore transport system permease protein, partial [Chloroflexota bacterium]|nr:polyether ionophore transport system permease protein [Chloroflexota bacterium]